MNERMALCWLGLNRNLDLRSKHGMLAHFGSALKAYQADLGTLTELGRMDHEKAVCLMKTKTEILDKWLAEVKRNKAQVVTLADPDYPVHLKHISFPPLFLYYRGICTKKDFLKTLAVVGSRKASWSGQQNTRDMVRQLAARGLTIVSGLAAGIDTQAHQAALDVHGKTVAVLGCGIDRCYPAQNKFLMDQVIAQGGVVLSEFALGTPPLAGNFPMRNRIISGMSMGVLVTEAGLKSGSLVTARYAGEQGREVYAFPGDIHRKTAIGSNRLLKDGAKLVLNSEDIFEDMAPMFPN